MHPVAVALANTAVLMSLVIYFMLTVSPVSIVAVLTVIGILRQPADLSGGTAAGLILGNLVGGLAATAAYILVTLLPSPAFLLLVVLLVGLLFGDRIARGGESAPIYTVSLATFLIVLGLGLSPLPQDSSCSSLPASSTSWWRLSTPLPWPACCARRFAHPDGLRPERTLSARLGNSRGLATGAELWPVKRSKARTRGEHSCPSLCGFM